jgi:hypothetical protein
MMCRCIRCDKEMDERDAIAVSAPPVLRGEYFSKRGYLTEDRMGTYYCRECFEAIIERGSGDNAI